ncbi:hypothetical protein BH11PLA1_BH11PLA1_16450 [soil metagenome]
MTARHAHPACAEDAALLAECRVTTGRTGGPGGQNRNKVETAVVITHVTTGLVSRASERRSQLENRQMALRRMRLLLAIEVRGVAERAPPRVKPGGDVADFVAALDASAGKKGKPSSAASDLWRARVRTDGGLAVNVRHHDYPALLAEAFDVLADEDWEPKGAADRLGVTASQLVKFIGKEGAAFEKFNALRARAGKKALYAK